MIGSPGSAHEPLGDRAIDAALSASELLAKGYRDYERYRLRRLAGKVVDQTRDVLRAGRVAAVLPIDVARSELVLIRQFRLPAHLANGHGEMVEIVAGRVEAGERPVDAARRECVEEIGVAPDALFEIMTYLSSPGLIDEEITLFLGAIDASRVPQRAGAADESEDIATLRVPIDAALDALPGGTMRNANLLIALQWLALSRNRLDAILSQSRSI